MACVLGHTECAQLLVSAGARMDLTSKVGIPPLYASCKVGRSAAVELLLKAGAPVDQALKNGCTALYGACQEGQVECARLLLGAGAAVQRQNERGESPLWIACSEGQAACTELLISHGAEVNLADAEGCTSLFLASEKGHVACTQLLLAAGAASDQPNQDGTTPLRMACQCGQAGTARLLIDAGASPSKPLSVACLQGHEGIAQQLLDAGAAIDGNADEGDATPLIFACLRGHAGCAKMLLEASPDANGSLSAFSRREAREAALSNGHNACVKLLERFEPKKLCIIALQRPDGQMITISIPGERVMLQALQARADLNGASGTLQTYDKERERFGVQLDSGGQPIAVKLLNLQLSDARPIAEPEDETSVMFDSPPPPVEVAKGVGFRHVECVGTAASLSLKGKTAAEKRAAISHLVAMRALNEALEAGDLASFTRILDEGIGDEGGRSDSHLPALLAVARPSPVTAMRPTQEVFQSTHASLVLADSVSRNLCSTP